MDSELGVERVPLPVGSTDGRDTGGWGMLMLIATEASLFAYLLFGYYYFCVQFGLTWLPAKLPEFRLSAPNTLILIISSLTVNWAQRSIERNRQTRLLLGLIVTIVLGCVFMAIQAVEWSNKTFTPATSSYGSFYFITTGLHMAHVAVGIVLLIGVAFWSALGHFDQHRHAPVAIASVYWHFVDVVWLTVFFSYYIFPRLLSP